ncbi:hypothetical protein Stsp01_59030 [Streptomyces sp. NBRC 13847]|nr:hypothetical protein Stsp01_59030 [Streptomyces sp. NBRC 13847]
MRVLLSVYGGRGDVGTVGGPAMRGQAPVMRSADAERPGAAVPEVSR